MRVFDECLIGNWGPKVSTCRQRRFWSDLTGRMPRLIWIFAGCTDHFVGFVMLWLIYQVEECAIGHSCLLDGPYLAHRLYIKESHDKIMSGSYFKQSQHNYTSGIQSSVCSSIKFLKWVYLSNHSSESIHILVIVTLEDLILFHKLQPQGSCSHVSGWGWKLKSGTTFSFILNPT